MKICCLGNKKTARFFFAAFAGLVFLRAAQAVFAADTRPQSRLETKSLTVQKTGGERVTMVSELARTVSEKQRGLMFRKSLSEGEGMLFLYDRDERMSFWMKNTLIPLSIAFISKNGMIIDIFDMDPLHETPVRSSRSVRYALEVPQGWFARQGIAEGDLVMELP